MIEKMADDLIGQMTEARLIDKEMEASAYSAKTEHSLRMSGALFR